MSDKKDRRIGELEKEIKQLKTLAYEDELTGLYNRHGFKETAGKFIAEIEREKSFKGKPGKSLFIKDFALIIFDIDDFKKITDKYGHDIGDFCLKHVVNIIKSNIRESDWIARWGGDEIMLMLFDSDEMYASNVLERISVSLEENSIPNSLGYIKITISVGVTQFESEYDFEKYFKTVDTSLLEAKRRGKGQIVYSSKLGKGNIV